MKNSTQIMPIEVNSYETAKAWAEITVKIWRSNIKRKKIGDSGDLERSFLIALSNANGDIAKIQFAFLYYGKFVDMGVGKGTKLGDVKDNAIERRLRGSKGLNKRRPKKWFSQTLYGEVVQLSLILQKKYGKGIAGGLAAAISEGNRTIDLGKKGGNNE